MLWLVMTPEEAEQHFPDVNTYQVCTEPPLVALMTKLKWEHIPGPWKIRFDMAIAIEDGPRVIKYRYGAEQRIQTEALADRVCGNLQTLMSQIL